MIFGTLLKELREQSGLTQTALATAAGMSLNSVQRGEASTACPFRRSNALAIFKAINARVPVTDAQADAFGAAAGIGPLITELRKAPPLDPALAIASEEQARRHTAHIWLDMLLDEMHPDQVLDALRGMAAAWGVHLGSPLTAFQSNRYTRMAQAIATGSNPAPPLPAVKISTVTDGVPVDEYHPTNPPPAPAAKPHRKSAT